MGWGFGNNEDGQLGLPNSKRNYQTPTQCGIRGITQLDTTESACFGLTDRDCVLKWGAFSIQGIENNSVQPVDGLPPIRKLGCGGVHALFLSHDNHLWGVGSKFYNVPCFAPARIQPFEDVTDFSC